MPDDFTPAQRRNFRALLIATGLYFCGISFMLLLPKYLKVLGAGEEQIGWLVGAPLLPFLLLSPVVGSLSDRLSAKWLAMAGIALAAVSGYWMGQCSEVGWGVYVLRGLYGAGHALVFTSLFAMVARILSPEQKARGIAYFSVVIQIGNVLGSFAGSLIIGNLGYSWFFIASTAVLGLALVACLGVRDPRAERASAAPAGFYRGVFGDRRIVGGLVMIVALGGAFGTVLQFVPTYLDFLYHSGAVAAPIPGFYFLTSTLITVVLARAVVGPRVYRVGGEQVLGLCMLGLPLAVLTLCAIAGPISTVAASVLFGATYGLLYPAMNGLVLNRVDESHQGKMSGLLAMVFEGGFRGFGFIMGPVAEGLSYFAMFRVLAALVLAGFAAFFFLEADRRRWVLGRRHLPLGLERD